MRTNRMFGLLCYSLSFAALYQINAQHYETSLADVPLLIFSYLAAAGLFFKAFFQALKPQVATSSQRLFPLLCWLGSFGVVATYGGWLNQLDYALNFMHVSSGSDYSIAGFTFKKDGRYIYWNGSGFGESRNYGTYTQQDSIIVLQPDSPRNAPRQTHLLIRPYLRFATPAFTPTSRLYLLDGDGLTAKFDTGYRIVELAAN